jgi:hypothetical protein
MMHTDPLSKTFGKMPSGMIMFGDPIGSSGILCSWVDLILRSRDTL